MYAGSRSCVSWRTPDMERESAFIMRIAFTAVLALAAAGLLVCAYHAYHAKKKLALSVCNLLIALVPPVLGNMLIISTGNAFAASVGYYIFFLGMNLVVFTLLSFTFEYCMIDWPGEKTRGGVIALLAADSLQLLLNTVTGHAFSTRPIQVDGFDYYQLIPLFGQGLHRLIDYGIILMVILIFALKLAKAPRVYAERYAVVLMALLFVVLWETFYIYTASPVDSSMIGFGIFGMLIYYFALFYRPVRLLNRLLVQVTSGKEDAYFFFDGVGRPVWANEAGKKLVNLPGDEFDLLDVELRRVFGPQYFGRGDWKEKRSLDTEEGTKYYSLEKKTMMDDRGAVAGSFLIIQDQTEDQRMLQRERYLATHDRLTDLYTREHLHDQIQRRIALSGQEKLLIIIADVYNFKIINDIYGNAFGNRTLIQIGDLIRSIAGERGIYGRVSGDTFGICLPKEDFDQEKAEEALRNFVATDGFNTHHVLIHMGVYETSEADRNMDISLMFDRARIALSGIKNDYNTFISFYTRRMRENVVWDEYISLELPGALEKKQIVPYLQPIVDREGRAVGAEILARWDHPELGVLSPTRFIPVFERNGMIADVDRYMWRCAGEILARWKERGLDLFLSINVSPKDFYFMDVAEEIRNIVKEFGIEPPRLRIEITETVMMTDVKNRVRMLNELKEEGFLIEMDDFGSGYSSLNMLKDMPIELIKIDMAFLRQTTDSEKSKTILNNILRMSGELGIVSLTEGVESDRQYQLLAERGCSLFQGFYFARPMILEDYERWQKQNAEARARA